MGRLSAITMTRTMTVFLLHTLSTPAYASEGVGKREHVRLAQVHGASLGNEASDFQRRDDHRGNAATWLNPVTDTVEPVDGTDHIEAIGAKLSRRHFPPEHGTLVVQRISRGGQGRSA